MVQRLLYVIDSLGPGGAERSFTATVPGLVRHGLDVHVAYLTERPGLHEQLRAAGATLHPLLGPGRFNWTRQVHGLARDLRPDLVHTTLFEADVAGRVGARWARVPCVTSLVNETYGPEHRADPALSVAKLSAAQAVDIATCRLARRFHAVSEHVATTMGKRLRIDPRRIEVIPRGRDPITLGSRTPERRDAKRRELGIEPYDLLVVAVARQEFQKGLDVLVEAMPTIRAGCPRVHVLVAGREGAETAALRARLRALSCEDRFSLLGTRDDVPDLLCAADVFVLPSRREGMPGAVIEAMALEAPVVATDLPQVREVVDDDTASLVRHDDPRALSAAIVATARDRGSARARAERARQRFVDRFTIDAVVTRMIGFYERALGKV